MLRLKQAHSLISNLQFCQSRIIICNRCASSLKDIFPKHENFSKRHIGPSEKQQKEMLDLIGVKVITFSCYLYISMFLKNYMT